MYTPHSFLPSVFLSLSFLYISPPFLPLSSPPPLSLLPPSVAFASQCWDRRLAPQCLPWSSLTFLLARFLLPFSSHPIITPLPSPSTSSCIDRCALDNGYLNREKGLHSHQPLLQRVLAPRGPRGQELFPPVCWVTDSRRCVWFIQCQGVVPRAWCILGQQFPN